MDTTAFRLFNGPADGINGLVIEKLGDVLVFQLHEGRLKLGERGLLELAGELRRRLAARAVYRKWFVRDRAALSEAMAAEHTRAQPWIGAAVEPELAILENGVRFLIRPYDGFSVGLFWEHRETRRRVRELAAGRRVLNTFAYTCGFSVVAAAGGAASTASVDLHKRYLEWGKRNFQANGTDLAEQLFFCSDTFEFYKRAERQGRRYDLIVLDPPTFSRGHGSAPVFVLAEQLERLVAGAMRLLDPGGLVVLSTNDRGMPRARMEEALRRAAAGRSCTMMEPVPLPIDFAGDPDYSKTLIAEYG